MGEGALQRLPTGVTGFWTTGLSPLPEVDPKAFAAACHLVARAAGGSAEPAASAFLQTNYLTMTIRERSGTVRVVCNAIHPLVAFVGPAGDTVQPMPFIDRPDLADLFETLADFHPLSTDWLRSAVSKEVIGSLDPAELQRVRYWQPSTIGEVVFNCWD